MRNAGEIRGVAADLVARTVSDVTIDMSGVTFIGAAAISALMAADDLISGIGGRMLIVGASPFAQRVFGLAGGRALPLFVLPPVPAGGPGGAGADDDEELSRLLFQVSRLLLTEPTVTGDLQTVVRAAVDLVPGCRAASIAVIARSAPRSAAVSDQVAVEVDMAQYATDEGPCLDAVRLADRIRLDSLSAERRFARFGLLAGRLGIGAVLSVPVVSGDVTIGSVNLYSASGFTADAEAVSGVIAAQAAAALIKSSVYPAALTLARGVQQRTDEDRDANIAVGVLAGFEYCSIEQAELLLRSSASATGQSVAAAARRIIDYLLGPEPIGP